MITALVVLSTGLFLLSVLLIAWIGWQVMSMRCRGSGEPCVYLVEAFPFGVQFEWVQIIHCMQPILGQKRLKPALQFVSASDILWLILRLQP